MFQILCNFNLKINFQGVSFQKSHLDTVKSACHHLPRVPASRHEHSHLIPTFKNMLTAPNTTPNVFSTFVCTLLGPVHLWTVYENGCKTQTTAARTFIFPTNFLRGLEIVANYVRGLDFTSCWPFRGHRPNSLGPDWLRQFGDSGHQEILGHRLWLGDK